MVKRAMVMALVASLAMTLAPGVARAGVWDDGTTGGPFDLRWVGAVRTQNARIKLTVGLWPGFTVSALPKGAAFDPRQHVDVTVQGSPDGDFEDGAYQHSGFFFRRDGRIWFHNGEFGSSPCCWTDPVTRIDRNTLAGALHPVVGAVGSCGDRHPVPLPRGDEGVRRRGRWFGSRGLDGQ